jgi:hypothetical protein
LHLVGVLCNYTCIMMHGHMNIKYWTVLNLVWLEIFKVLVQIPALLLLVFFEFLDINSNNNKSFIR